MQHQYAAYRHRQSYRRRRRRRRRQSPSGASFVVASRRTPVDSVLTRVQPTRTGSYVQHLANAAPDPQWSAGSISVADGQPSSRRHSPGLRLRRALNSSIAIAHDEGQRQTNLPRRGGPTPRLTEGLNTSRRRRMLAQPTHSQLNPCGAEPHSNRGVLGFHSKYHRRSRKEEQESMETNRRRS